MEYATIGVGFLTILFAKFVYDLQARLDKEPPKTPLQLQAEEYQKILPQVILEIFQEKKVCC